MIPAIGSTLPKVELAPTSNLVTGAANQGGVAGGQSFGAVLTQIASDAVSTVKSAEATSIKGVNGQTSTQAVVEAVMDAERTLQTAIAVRDKAVAAYMELSRMSI